VFTEAEDDGSGGDNWSKSRAKLQSHHHHQQTNTKLFTSQMPFVSPIQQCQNTEGKQQNNNYYLQKHFTDNNNNLGKGPAESETILDFAKQEMMEMAVGSYISQNSKT